MQRAKAVHPSVLGLGAIPIQKSQETFCPSYTWYAMVLSTGHVNLFGGHGTSVFVVHLKKEHTTIHTYLGVLALGLPTCHTDSTTSTTSYR